MLVAWALAAFATAGCAWLAAVAFRDHRAMLAARATLLDGIAGLFPDAWISLGADGFPSLSARLPDCRQVSIELIPDTMVIRRLPQLWLLMTVREPVEVRRPSLGALARFTGAEFYALSPDLPERVDDPLSFETGLLIRQGGGLDAADLKQGLAALRTIFADPAIKEAVATSRGVRVVRQASEGDRGAHLLLRQVRFPLTQITKDSVLRCLAAADTLRDALDSPPLHIETLSA